MARNRALLVFDYNGTVRSGKGTIVNYLRQSYPQLATSEETGKDYRAITKVLLAENLLSPGMSAAEVTEIVSQVSPDKLAQIVEGRAALIAEHGEDSLYEESVNNLVAGTGQSFEARQAVKAGLKKRVEEICQAGRYKVLLLDGRNLSPIVDGLAGVEIRLRTFVACTPEEAARRECLRLGVPLDSPEAQQIQQSVAKRTQEDENRQHDAVIKDNDALDYWNPPELNGIRLAELAVKTKRQIYFDTTPFSKENDSKAAMLAAADKMFNDALNFTL